MKYLFFFLCSLGMSGSVLADANSCDDYLARHYRKDLILQSVVFSQQTRLPFHFRPYQAVRLTVKNTGEMDFNSASSDSGEFRNVYVKIKGVEYRTRMRVPLDSGEQTVLNINLPLNTLSHCGQALIQIDTRHTAGQWGCQVWNNDTKKVKTNLQGARLCR